MLGPLENADLVGLELTKAIHDVVLPTLSKSGEPSRELTRRIERGDTGVAAGRGFYDHWSEPQVAALRQRLAEHIATGVAK